MSMRCKCPDCAGKTRRQSRRGWRPREGSRRPLLDDESSVHELVERGAAGLKVRKYDQGLMTSRK